MSKRPRRNAAPPWTMFDPATASLGTSGLPEGCKIWVNSRY